MKAVRHGPGPLLIFAGAGSGKTRVLTRRIANLILEHHVHPSQILAVTFTNKAANEMKQRVEKLFGQGPIPTWVSTFHSMCSRILRLHAKCLNYTPNFVIYDSSESQAVLKRAFKKLKLDPRVIDIKTVASRIDRAKNNYQFSDSIRTDRYTPEALAHMMADLFDAYQEDLRNSNAMDFGDLLCNTVTLFTLEPQILENFQNRFQYVMIDEYQDTNRVQYLLVHQLAGKHQNLCVVGDDDQSIYAFRGASIENIRNFKKDFPQAEVITLHRNYRSTKTILDAANCIIAKNSNRQKKQMTTDNPRGRQISLFHAFDEKDEAEHITRQISSLLSEGIKASDIAVFYRTNAQSRAVEELLCENNIPYEIYGSYRFYERKEIRDILAYCRLLLNPSDNEAFLRVVNTPTRGLGASSVGALAAFADSAKKPLLAALDEALTSGAKFLTAAAKKKFTAFREIITDLQADAEKTERLLQTEDGTHSADERFNAIGIFLGTIADKTGYLAELKADDTPEADSRMENIYELLEVASEFARRAFSQGEIPTIAAFLERTSLTSDLDKENTKTSSGEAKKKPAAISLMTLHLAKGLEFKIVFLLGLEEGILPHVRALDDRTELEEERRLCYVGITRAQQRLYLSRAQERQSFGRASYYSGLPSRFLDELPRHLIDEHWSAPRTY